LILKIILREKWKTIHRSRKSSRESGDAGESNYRDEAIEGSILLNGRCSFSISLAPSITAFDWKLRFLDLAIEEKDSS